MKHIFFAFPSGLAGTALLLLRGSVALFLISVPAEMVLETWIALAIYLVVLAIVVGFSTRIAAGLSVATCLALLWKLETAAMIPLLSHGLAAAALALIGPGAFSIDAHLFGRRTIHLAE